MKISRLVPFIVVLVIFVSGCANYQTVKVLVIDDNTKVPIPGATVITCYAPSHFSVASRRQFTGKTGKDGTVVLRANYLEHEPTLFGKSRFPFEPSYVVEAPGYMDVEETESSMALKYEEANPSRKADITIETDAGSSEGRPPDAFKDPSHPYQWGQNLKIAWLWLTSPFRPAPRALTE